MVSLFTVALAGGAADPHAEARRWMAEAEQTSNPVRLLKLAFDIRGALEEALRLRPDDVEVRLDLVRFHAVTPRIAGGNMDEARVQIEEIARRNEPMGHFARGYVAYREKQFGVARIEFREAIKTPAVRPRALRWLGWLSQESQQWDDAFVAFEELGDLYEVARTSSFCKCRVERGRQALREHLRKFPKDAKAKKLRMDHR
jgi:hypothetical protein